MSKQEIAQLKATIHEQIDKIDDKTALQMLREAVETYSTTSQKDILDELTPEQLKRLEDSVRQANIGKTLSHEEVMQIAKEWLSR